MSDVKDTYDYGDVRLRLEKETTLGAGIGDGWWPIVCHAAWLLDHAYPGWKPVQIKEKFAGLRFYIDPAPFRDEIEGDEQDARWYDKWAENWHDEQQAIVRAAERACEGVCEICGCDAEAVGRGWIHTLCPDHAAKYEAAGTMRGLADA